MNEENTVVTPHFDDEDTIDLYQWIVFFWSHRQTFFWVITLSLVCGFVVSFIIPKQYTAVATILPPQVADSKLSGMLGSLGGLAGDMLGSDDIMSKVYPDIARSRFVLVHVLDAPYQGRTFKDVLQEHYRFKRTVDDNLILELQKNVIESSTSTKTNVVTISITYCNPEIAAAMANEVLDQMEVFFQYHFRSMTSGQRAMIEQRLAEVADSLKIAENNLLKFRESNRTTSLFPALQLLEGRLVREVEINNTVYLELTRQREMAKISEFQLTPVMNVLDRAVPPIEKSKPHRKAIVLIFGVLGFVSAFAYLIVYPQAMSLRLQHTHEIT